MTRDAISYFKDLHPLAELSNKEHKTQAYIVNALNALGIETQAPIGDTGVVGIIRGADPGPTVMFRADMDALPYHDDDKGLVAIHACGHDSHCAMLLAAAHELKSIVKKGTLKLVFQPGEENLTGALAMIRDGLIEDIDIAVGGHIRPLTDLAPGEMCSKLKHVACATVDIKLSGKTAHASRPHLGVNPLDVAASLIQNVNALRFNPQEAWSIKATRMQCEPGAKNSLAQWAVVSYDLRAETNPLLQDMLRRLYLMADTTALAFETRAHCDLIEECPASEYDPELVAMIEEEICSIVGPEGLKETAGGGGEDFHFYKTKKPSVRTAYFGVGVGATPGLHCRNMTFDTGYLKNGVALWKRIAARLLG